MSLKYIDFKNDILKYNADVNIVMGQRGDGKTYGALQTAIEEWYSTGHEFVIMRILEDEVIAKHARRFVAVIAPYILQRSHEEDSISYFSGQYFIERVNDKGDKEKILCGHVMSLSGWLKYKGSNYDNVHTIIMDEFNASRSGISKEEFLTGYMENLSTIVRHRGGVKVYCLGNTLTRKSPIFDYYGLNITKIKQGKPLFFKASNGLKILVLWADKMDVTESEGAKHIGVFGGNESKMITSGDWALNDCIMTEYERSGKTYTASEALQLSAYKSATKFYIFEYNSTIIIPSRSDYPIIVVNCKLKNSLPIRDELQFSVLQNVLLKISTKLSILCDTTDNLLLDILF